MSLIGQLPLAAIWFHCKDLEESKRFYKDVVGLKILEEGRKDSGVHFDLGNIRLSLLQMNSSKNEPSGTKPSSPSDHLVFVVENHIETVCADLVKRGVKLRPKKILEDSAGKAGWFEDPDGHMIELWQPPKRDSKNFKDVEMLVDHYESMSRALADLREEDLT